ncbi:hypothetical protein PHMEG_00036910 [Phytophthora megakarya]|uniref:Uncharacterized protein n=1 Tax=Phytophthora megakarya TaxID=4795 RepID=A0A225UKG8_9STRA|nr:hypothetical protein PHMEG_00036910 [Phytophthora megakarya]
MEFRIAFMGYSSVHPHSCQDSRVASGLVDVKKKMKVMVGGLAVSDGAKPARQILQELRSLFYENDSKVMTGLSESLDDTRIYRARALHFYGNVHESVGISQISLALNEGFCSSSFTLHQ